MPRKLNFPLLLILLLILLGVLLFKEITVLQLENRDRGRILNIPITRSSTFSITSTHSIYLALVTEEFEVDKESREISLRGVRTKSLRVAEYYGFVDAKEYYPTKRKMKSFALRVAMTNTQIISCGSRSLSLEEIGDKGERVDIRLAEMTLARYLLSLL